MGARRRPAFGATVSTKNALRCTECGRLAVDDAYGWRGLRTDLAEEGDEPELSFYCPECAEREFNQRPAYRPPARGPKEA
jgi:hypothetical protein